MEAVKDGLSRVSHKEAIDILTNDNTEMAVIIKG